MRYELRENPGERYRRILQGYGQRRRLPAQAGFV
jgi:hypothetical protein